VRRLRQDTVGVPDHAVVRVGSLAGNVGRVVLGYILRLGLGLDEWPWAVCPRTRGGHDSVLQPVLILPVRGGSDQFSPEYACFPRVDRSSFIMTNFGRWLRAALMEGLITKPRKVALY
jgi:hypothetical protein